MTAAAVGLSPVGVGNIGRPLLSVRVVYIVTASTPNATVKALARRAKRTIRIGYSGKLAKVGEQKKWGPNKCSGRTYCGRYQMMGAGHVYWYPIRCKFSASAVPLIDYVHVNNLANQCICTLVHKLIFLKSVLRNIPLKMVVGNQTLFAQTKCVGHPARSCTIANWSRLSLFGKRCFIRKWNYVFLIWNQLYSTSHLENSHLPIQVSRSIEFTQALDQDWPVTDFPHSVRADPTELCGLTCSVASSRHTSYFLKLIVLAKNVKIRHRSMSRWKPPFLSLCSASPWASSTIPVFRGSGRLWCSYTYSWLWTTRARKIGNRVIYNLRRKYCIMDSASPILRGHLPKSSDAADAWNGFKREARLIKLVKRRSRYEAKVGKPQSQLPSGPRPGGCILTGGGKSALIHIPALIEEEPGIFKMSIVMAPTKALTKASVSKDTWVWCVGITWEYHHPAQRRLETRYYCDIHYRVHKAGYTAGKCGSICWSHCSALQCFWLC